jgi:tetrapyrrole methylase family protein/MazG family protein
MPAPGSIVITGLGPGGLATLDGRIAAILGDADTVVVRTIEHPAAAELAADRSVVACDDLYESSETFDAVYSRIADRVIEAVAADRTVVYAVPGSPLLAERSVGRVRSAAEDLGIDVTVLPAPSFLDAMFEALRFDPARAGFQLLDGRDLPDPMPLHLPTVIFHVDLPLVLADVVDRLGRVLPEDTPVTVTRDLGSDSASVDTVALRDLGADVAGLRTSLFIDPPDVGYVGVVKTMRRLREECPWDRKQTHDTLVSYALEEVAELAEAISHLAPGAPARLPEDYGPYADIEDELGDVLLQVIFHANLAAEAGAFDMEDVAEQLRRKLVRRHPHVFGDVEVDGADEVAANWQDIKAEERMGRTSAMDGIPASMATLAQAVKIQHRAARVGFDWTERAETLDKVHEELVEVRDAVGDDARAAEIGDLLFAVVNVARRFGVEPDLALRRASAKFMARFRVMEAIGPLEGLSIDELNARWDQAKLDLTDGT